MDYNLQATVTGRIKMTHNPAIHQLPKEGIASEWPNQQGFLFRKGTELIAYKEAPWVYPSDFVANTEPGDLLLVLHPGRRRKPQLFSLPANEKYLWRQLRGRDALVQQLQVLALLQRS